MPWKTVVKTSVRYLKFYRTCISSATYLSEMYFKVGVDCWSTDFARIETDDVEADGDLVIAHAVVDNIEFVAPIFHCCVLTEVVRSLKQAPLPVWETTIVTHMCAALDVAPIWIIFKGIRLSKAPDKFIKNLASRHNGADIYHRSLE